MAVTIVDRRTTVINAESTTDWTPGSFGVQSDDVAEGTYAVAESLAIEDAPVYYTMGASVDLSDTLVYVYAFNNALLNPWNNAIPPIGLLLGDGTNIIGFNMAGADRRVFNHLDGPTSWQCLLLDGSQAATLNGNGLTYESSGTFASLALTAILNIGCYFQTLSKSLGGGYNVSVDIIRYGNNGIYILEGGSGTEGTCLEIAQADRSTAANAAHGIFRAYTTIAFGVQGPLTFGRADVATDSYFLDSGVVIVFEGRDVGNDKYFFNVIGHSTAVNYFKLSDTTISTAGPYVSCSFGANIDTFELDGVSFVALKNVLSFPVDSASYSHTVKNCTFNDCGQIDPGTVTFQSNVVSNYLGTSGGAILLDSDGSANWSNLSFISAGTGHAIYITATGTYDFNNFTYSGYGADGTTDAVVYNNSGGAVTINIAGGDSITVLNGSGASTTVNNTVTVTLTGMKDNTEVRVYEAGTTTEIAGIEDATDGTTDDRYWSFSAGGGTLVDIRVFNVNWISQNILNYTIPSSTTSLPVTQVTDRVYSNPV